MVMETIEHSALSQRRKGQIQISFFGYFLSKQFNITSTMKGLYYRRKIRVGTPKKVESEQVIWQKEIR